MAEYCLPKPQAAAFLAALKSGAVEPERLMGMSSGERRSFFKDLIGEDNAEAVNSLFESKMLLKDQQRGLVTWAKKIAGISEPRRNDILTKISKLDRILNPNEEKAFLADLAASKLGATVTSEEAKQIYELTKVAETAKTKLAKDGWSAETGTAYGRAVMDVKDKIESLKPGGQTFAQKVLDVASIPKSLLTSILHFSALGVQLWGSITRARTWEGFVQQFHYFADEENYKNLQGYMIGHPDYQLAMNARLGITRLGDQLSAREEAIQSSLVEKANKYISDKTGLPNLVRASSRAFTGYLNFVRFHSFTDLLTTLRLNGEDVSLGSKVVQDAAKVVNDFTGRGGLGKLDNSNTVATLNATFFAPRKVAATMHMFNPVRYLDPRISPTVRKEAARNLIGSLVATSAVLGMAKAMGADVDIDPRSANFAKVIIGGEKLDITGGNAIYLRLLARIASNQEVTAKDKLIELGKGYKPTTRADLVLAYTRGKLSPVMGALADAMYGQDPVGRPFSLTEEAKDKLLPIFMNNMINYGMNDPDNSAAFIPALSSFFGVGLESPLPQVGASNRDVWGEPPETKTPANDPVANTVARLGVQIQPAEKKIRGVPLSPDRYDDFQRLTGRMTKAAVSNAIQIPGFDQMPKGAQEELIKKATMSARRSAADTMMMQYPDIIAGAEKLKADKQDLGSPTAIARRPK